MKPQPVSEQDVQPHSVWQSILLHLLPGILLLVFYVLAVPIVENLGLPRRFASLFGVFLVLIPFQLGVLFYEGKKRNGKFSLQGIIVYRERIPPLAIFPLGSPAPSLVHSCIFDIIPSRWFPGQNDIFLATWVVFCFGQRLLKHYPDCDGDSLWDS